MALTTNMIGETENVSIDDGRIRIEVCKPWDPHGTSESSLPPVHALRCFDEVKNLIIGVMIRTRRDSEVSWHSKFGRSEKQ